MSESESTGQWRELRRHTQARIALGRVGASMPTEQVLAFSMAHARARDAVHLPLDTRALAQRFAAEHFSTLVVRSQASSRAEYLRRPDLGRSLHPESVTPLTSSAEPHRLTVIVADGLSALAADRHALPLMLALRDQLAAWSLDTIVIATQARVALGDAIGELRGAEAVLMLIGERPGLTAPDSLGVYLSYAPRVGRMDAERNCVSNIRAGGLTYAEAAHKLLYLLQQARLAGRSGIAIKDGSDAPPMLP